MINGSCASARGSFCSFHVVLLVLRVAAARAFISPWDMAKTGIDLAMYRLTIGVWVAVAGGGRTSHSGFRALTSRRSPGLFFIVLFLFILLRADALPRTW